VNKQLVIVLLLLRAELPALTVAWVWPGPSVYWRGPSEIEA
jgi:hypothetical protein